MAVVNKRTLVDSGTRHVVMFEINNATNDAVQVIDASALRGHSSNPTLDISAIKWNTTALTSDVAIEFDASTDDHAISLHGSGEYGYHGKQPNITNPESTGVTGDIVITNSSAVTGTFIIEVKKTKGYDNSGQTR
jgi:hypothetical protein|tara:strand:- start:2104 stop:2508 length:405 start_codon:yes stop_codon:yes gene_type:complete